MIQYKHHPATKQHLKEAMYEQMYRPLLNNFQTRLEKLVISNCITGNLSHLSFMYRGELYNCSVHPFPRPANRLAPQFFPVMRDYLNDLKELNEEEIPFVMGYVGQVLNATDSLEDYLLLLPASIHAPIHELRLTCIDPFDRLGADQLQRMLDKKTQLISFIKQKMLVNLLTEQNVYSVHLRAFLD